MVFSLFLTSLVWFNAPPAQGQTLASVSVSDITITEGNGSAPVAYRNALVTFSVTGTRNGSLRVDYNTVDIGSATADVDFRNFSQTVIIAQGQSAVTRAVRIYGDTEPEPTETLEVHLSNPVNATIADGVGVVTIIDNDNYVPPAGPTISVADASVIETDAGTSTANLAVTLS
ncbi:MAG: Calx-beta domain-containing protein, partial [Acidimicrobiales bacterium]